jgi:hypothetical protein
MKTGFIIKRAESGSEPAKVRKMGCNQNLGRKHGSLRRISFTCVHLCKSETATLHTILRSFAVSQKLESKMP